MLGGLVLKKIMLKNNEKAFLEPIDFRECQE
jgi:hypothetical protein